MSDALARWDALIRFVNERPGLFGEVGVRDPEHVCGLFDGKGYDGTGGCLSDGHCLCTECSQLSPKAPRFAEHDGGRRDRLIYYFAHRRRAQPVVSRATDRKLCVLGGVNCQSPHAAWVKGKR